MLRRALIRFNNAFTRLRGVRVAPADLLVLVPHCLQRGGCPQNIVGDSGACRRCGGCGIGELMDACEARGIMLVVAAGGRQALARAQARGVRAVVAVACEKELVDGIRATFPKPMVAIPNDQPNGPCRETAVSIQTVTAAIASLLSPP